MDSFLLRYEINSDLFEIWPPIIRLLIEFASSLDTSNNASMWLALENLIFTRLNRDESLKQTKKSGISFGGMSRNAKNLEEAIKEIAELRAENLQLIKDATNLDNAIDSNDVGFDGRSQIANTPSVSNDVFTRG